MLKFRPMISMSRRFKSGAVPQAHHVIHDPLLKEFSLGSNKEKAVLQYEEYAPSTIDLMHTIVPDSLRGKNVGNILVEAALDHALHKNLKVKASCTFVQHYFKKNPKLEYKELLET